jgi:hypothetical protein
MPAQKRSYGYFISLLTFVLVISCQKIEQMPPEPYVEFTSFTIFDTTDILGNTGKAGRLQFHFEDGDGDVGLKEPTAEDDDTTDVFISLYRKENGVMVLSTDKNDPLLPSSSYRAPYMERLGQNKLLTGTISIIMLYQSFSFGDTVMYDFYIRDRALNESNRDSTGEIIVSENNIYYR